MAFSLLLIIAVISVQQCNSNLERRLGAEAMLNMAEAKFEALKTESGNNAAKTRQQVATYEVLLAAKGAEIERLRKQLGIRPRAIKEYVEVFIKGGDTLRLTQTVSKDSFITSAPYEYRDNWNLFQAYQVGNEIELLYGVQDSLRFVWSETVGGIEVQAINSNPSITFTGLNSFTIPPKAVKRKRFVLSVGPGFGATKDGLRASLTAQLGYKLFEF